MKPLKLIALLLFLGGAAWALTRSERAVREIQSRYFAAISPFIKAGSGLENHAHNFLTEVRHSKDLEAELATVKDDLGRLPIIEARCEELERKNSQLRAALGFREAVPFKVAAARVTRRQPATWWRTVDIDAGSNRGVAPNRPVLSNGGALVGVVNRAMPEWASVVLLTDESCQVSAKVENSREEGILTGQRGLADGTPMLRLKFLSKDAVLQPGQRVFTTGRGGIFKADILLGTIVTLEKGAADSEAVVEPAVGFADLGTVFVVVESPDPPK